MLKYQKQKSWRGTSIRSLNNIVTWGQKRMFPFGQIYLLSFLYHHGRSRRLLVVLFTRANMRSWTLESMEVPSNCLRLSQRNESVSVKNLLLYTLSSFRSALNSVENTHTSYMQCRLLQTINITDRNCVGRNQSCSDNSQQVVKPLMTLHLLGQRWT